GLESLEGQEVFNRLIKSTAWIVTVVPDGTVTGSGSLIDRDNKLVLTNYHVVMDHLTKKGRISVFFPMYDKGKLVMEKERYRKLVDRKEGIPCHVVHHDKKRDLALVKLVEVPEGIQPLKIARTSPFPGQRVHSLGNPGRSGALWAYTNGSVKAVYQKDWV